jgi:hypothetical protein
MALELDHVFICCSPGAPEADALTGAGLREGSANTHPGQGTANRRFFFSNAYIEFVWVADADEARSPRTAPTRLYERCFPQTAGVCPFGIVFRPQSTPAPPAPFGTWSYRPGYLPSDASIEIATDTGLGEPELVYLPFGYERSFGHGPTEHALPIRQISGISIGLPLSTSLSAASRTVRSAGLVSYWPSDQYVVELSFAAPTALTIDLRPTLPLLFRADSSKD